MKRKDIQQKERKIQRVSHFLSWVTDKSAKGRGGQASLRAQLN